MTKTTENLMESFATELEKRLDELDERKNALTKEHGKKLVALLDEAITGSLKDCGDAIESAIKITAAAVASSVQWQDLRVQLDERAAQLNAHREQFAEAKAKADAATAQFPEMKKLMDDTLEALGWDPDYLDKLVAELDKDTAEYDVAVAKAKEHHMHYSAMLNTLQQQQKRFGALRARLAPYKAKYLNPHGAS